MDGLRFFRWAVTVLMAAYLCAPVAAVAREMSPNEKIRIISRIVKAKVNENWDTEEPWEGLNGKDNDVLSEILAEVEKIMPLQPDKKIELPPDVAQKLEDQAWETFPASDKELKANFTIEAEKKFPVYQTGDVVTVYYRIYGGTYDSTTGKFYRQDPKFVWIGDRTIAKADLRDDYASRFDPVQTDRLRQRFIEESIAKYHQKRAALEKDLKEGPLRNRQGYLRYRGKWLSVEGVVRKLFRETVNIKMEKAKSQWDEL